MDDAVARPGDQLIGILADDSVKGIIQQLRSEKETLVLTGRRTTLVRTGFVGESSYAYAAPVRDDQPLDPVREAEALAVRGCDMFVSFGVGTLIKDHWKPGNTLLPSDYVDFDSGPWAPREYPQTVPMWNPFCANLRGSLMKFVKSHEGAVIEGKTVSSLSGPFTMTQSEFQLVKAVGPEAVCRNVGAYAKVAAAHGACYQPIVMLRGYEYDPADPEVLKYLLADGVELPYDYAWVRPRLWNLVFSFARTFPSQYECIQHNVAPKTLDKE